MSSPSLDGKTVLVTGGTGTIGTQVVHELLSAGATVVVFSRDQNKLFKMNHSLASTRVKYRNGDICDYKILLRAVKGVDYAVHCAASKHVPLCEENPDSSIKNNIEGTRNLLEACSYWNVKKVLLLSTDKAVNPTCVMGATKFLAEKLFMEFNKIIPCSIVRLGNVFASNGSVVPTFLDRIKNGIPLIVNHPEATRFFLTVKEAGLFIVERLSEMSGGEIFIKRMKLMTILQLANVMKPTSEYPVRIGSMSEGEKIDEFLIAKDEYDYAHDMGDYYMINKGIKTIQKVVVSTEHFTNQEIAQMLSQSK